MRLAAFAGALVALAAGLAACSAGDRPGFAHDMKVWARQLRSPFTILVEPGDEQGAHDYYARIKLPIGYDPEGSTLGTVLTHFGYPGLTAEQVEFTASADLMTQTPGLRASRFFAPKIVDFNAPKSGPDEDNFVPGWRKVVFLPARPGSDAEKAGLASAWILFNYFQPKTTDDPFARESGNNQVMLIPAAYAADKDSAFWLVYRPRSQGYRIGYALNAAFDVPNAPGDPTTRDYFVPTACAQCHGHDDTYGGPAPGRVFASARLNYLDTDQWYDMLAFDFPKTAQGPLDVLVDGGKDHGLPAYATAVGVVRDLNEAIRNQNNSAQHVANDFRIAAVDKWLALHRSDPAPQPRAVRALSVGGGVVWSPGSLEDQAALERLDRFCFRCHGSMYYDVFDKAAVVDLKGSMIRRIRSGSMPQGRTLSAQERTALVEALEKVR